MNVSGINTISTIYGYDAAKNKKSDDKGVKLLLQTSKDNKNETYIEDTKDTANQEIYTNVTYNNQAKELFTADTQAMYQFINNLLTTDEDNNKNTDDYSKVLKIARRIARGDKVPAYDEKKLMEYSMDLYQMAKSSAMLHANKKHKKYKSLYKDEDKKHDIEKMIRAISEDDSTSKQVKISIPADTGNIGETPESEICE